MACYTIILFRINTEKEIIMRSTGIKPNLKLEKITGLRADKPRLHNTVNLKEEYVFPTPIKSIKGIPNQTRDGYKY